MRRLVISIALLLMLPMVVHGYYNIPFSPAAAGGPIWTQYFESSSSSGTCDGEVPAVTGEAGTRECDYATGCPEGSECARLGPNTTFDNITFDNIISDAGNAHWLSLCMNIAVDAGVSSESVMQPRDDGNNANHFIIKFDGTNDRIQVKCTTGTGTWTSNNVYTEGTWFRMILWMDESANEAKMWIGQNTDQTPDVVCDETDVGVNIDGIQFLIGNTATMDVRIDDIRWYDADPLTADAC